MEQTLVKTVVLPAAGPGGAPTEIARGTSVPVRALIENVGATQVFIAVASQDVVGSAGVGSATYQLVPGASRVYVLKDRQALFAAGIGINGRVSVSTSDALPLV